MKFIEGYDNQYSILDDGTVWSHYSNKFLRVKRRGNYKGVILSKGGKRKTHYIHRLVAFGFVPNPDNKPVVNHKDGNKLNNCADNLEWCTRSENAKHACSLGLMYPELSNKDGLLNGEGNGRAKLTKKQVIRLRAEAPLRKKGHKIWNEYGITQHHYISIIKNRSWKWLECP